MKILAGQSDWSQWIGITMMQKGAFFLGIGNTKNVLPRYCRGAAERVAMKNGISGTAPLSTSAIH
ncbi:hypothetical protein C5748_18640 [Phyllobacterium phragmitis]|uniref:Uncharacterized protein n=1 Tax=Phyllobacterium phragmitis TaxID=2670329 RepID=A0A2S9IN02_9HYPH|nr:hypothetical protein C5748_18640 [Phyllobacterium phragmitis]